MIPFAVLNSLVSDKKRIFACKLSDDFSGFVDTFGTGKRNRAGALVLGNGSIMEQNDGSHLISYFQIYDLRARRGGHSNMKVTYKCLPENENRGSSV